MSTKDLSRTVLEKGRPKGNKFYRRFETRCERMLLRNYLAQVTRDVELADELLEPQRIKVQPDLTDKLSPVYRFIDSRVGKSWAETGKLIKEKFDIRTLAGYHVVSAHIKGEISSNESQEYLTRYFYNVRRYYIDNDDILQASGHYQKYKRQLSKEQEIELLNWLDGRQLVFLNGILHWFNCKTPQYLIVTISNRQKDFVSYYTNWTLLQKDWDKYKYKYRYYFDFPLEFTKGHELSRDEVNYYRSLPDRTKRSLKAASKEVKRTYLYNVKKRLEKEKMKNTGV